MVTPVVNEDTWRQVLESLPSWTPPRVPTLVVSPHPDDETLSVGGLIHSLRVAGVEVSVVAVTDGENAYEGEQGLGIIREIEQADALSRLHVPVDKIHRLRLPDSGLHKTEAELVEALCSLAKPGMHILAPWTGDFHPDHEVCGRAARAVAERCGAHLTFYFFWTWHRGTPATLDGLDLVHFALAEEDLRGKQEALLYHASQLTHPSGQPILPEYLLEPMQRRYEVYLPT